ncbi:MAG TPA: glycosyltransferase family 4 protein [Pseudoxanthomonas sp.]
MNPERRRILLITRNLPPLVGGMERLNYRMIEELGHSAEVRVVAPVGSQLPAGVDARLEAVPLRPLWRFLAGALIRGIRIARRWKPQFVMAGSGLSAPAAWFAARACGAKVGVYLHGLDIALRHPVYSLLWLSVIRRMDVVVANSRATRSVAIERGVPAERISLVHPGVELPSAEALAADIACVAFREDHGLGTGPILLSVGRLTERKGLREFVRDVLPGVVSHHPDLRLVVVGDIADDALAAKSQSRESIQAEAERIGIGANLLFVGVITDPRALSQAYRCAAVHVFPVRERAGDPEGFGMVAIEAAAHGLQTVAYATGGIVDAVAEGVSGRLASPGDYEALSRHILDLLSAPLPQSPMRAFAARFAWPLFGTAIRSALSMETVSSSAATSLKRQA